MNTKSSDLFRKWIYQILSLFAVVVVFTIVLTLSISIRPKLTLAVQNDDANQPADTNQPAEDKKVPRPEHKHPAFNQRREERAKMVAWYIQPEDIRDPNTLKAMRTVPRHAFVKPRDLRRAYKNHPLSIDLGQTISQPYIVAYMTEALKLKPGFKALEIGTGSGYQAAVLAEIVQEVYTIEIIEELARSAKVRLKQLGYRNVFSKAGDGFFGWREKGPFDVIIVTAAAGIVPPPLIEQLKPGGRIILPLGSPFGAQTLVLVTKDNKGRIRSRHLLPVRFVPMVGRVMKGK